MSGAVHTVPSHPHLKLGRQSRNLTPMLNFSQLKALFHRTVKAVEFDYTQGLPDDLGVLWNDTYGCCTAAAKYHRWQMIQMLVNGVFVPGDVLADLALRFYGESTGFKATDPNTDQGGNMADIAQDLVSAGMPLPDGTIDKFTAAFEVDPTNLVDLSYVGQQCFGVDFGITVTTAVLPADGSNPPRVWDDVPGATKLGGHDVYSMARLANGNFKANSWGGWYELTPAFLRQNLMEAYGYVATDALKDGKTVLGLAEVDWENAMNGYATRV